MKKIRLFSLMMSVIVMSFLTTQDLKATGCVQCSLNSDNDGSCKYNNGLNACFDEEVWLANKCKYGATSLGDCTIIPE